MRGGQAREGGRVGGQAAWTEECQCLDGQRHLSGGPDWPRHLVCRALQVAEECWRGPQASKGSIGPRQPACGPAPPPP